MANAATSPLGVYLDHLEKGELAYQFSPEADRAVFYPRVICPNTGSDNLEWRISKGIGYSARHHCCVSTEGRPYNVALIDVDEGFRMMSRVEDIAPPTCGSACACNSGVHPAGGRRTAVPGLHPGGGAA